MVSRINQDKPSQVSLLFFGRKIGRLDIKISLFAIWGLKIGLGIFLQHQCNGLAFPGSLDEAMMSGALICLEFSGFCHVCHVIEVSDSHGSW